MAREGLVFTDFHFNCPVCNPTRAALISGKYLQRVGIETVVYADKFRHTGINPGTYTIASHLKSRGYQTGIVGKWHLGGVYQTTQGIYYDTLTSVNGCDSIFATTLSLLPKPLVDIGPDTLLACDGETLLFDAYDEDFTSYYWIDQATDSVQRVIYSSTNPKSVQIVQVTGSNGCTAQDRVLIVDNSNVNMFMDLPPQVSDPTASFSINYMPDNVDGWYWSFGDGDTLSGDESPSHS